MASRRGLGGFSRGARRGATFPSGGDIGGRSGRGFSEEDESLEAFEGRPQVGGDRRGRRQANPSVGAGRGGLRNMGRRAIIRRPGGENFEEGEGGVGRFREMLDRKRRQSGVSSPGQDAFTKQRKRKAGGGIRGAFDKLKGSLGGGGGGIGAGDPAGSKLGALRDRLAAKGQPEEGPSPTTASDELRRLNSALDAPGRENTLGPGGTGGIPPEKLGGEAIGLENLGGVVERNLGSNTDSGGFGSEEALRFRQIAGERREDERSQGIANIGARAANRGTFFSSIPSGQEGSLEERLQRSADQTDLELQNQIAAGSFRGSNRAVDDAFRFNQSSFSNSQAGRAGLASMAGLAGQLGGQGAPDLNIAAGRFGIDNFAQPGGGNQDLNSVLGQLFQSGRPVNRAA